jgi:hypothetical protein
MWRLEHFERDWIWVPEIANPPSWEGVVAFLVAALCIWLLTLVWNAGRTRRQIWQSVMALIPFAILTLLVLCTFPIAGNLSGLNFFVLMGLGYLAYVIVVVVSLCERIRMPGGIRRAMCGILLAAVFTLAFVCYSFSFPYYLPASYPEPTCSQLRMLRRLIEVERGDDQGKAKMIPLSEARLTYEGRELIPDSMRENGRYGNYEYAIHFNTPGEGLFTIDAVPIEQKDKLYSFHLFPTNPQTLDEEYSYVVYCITMAKHNGEPATAADPHFHRRGLIKIILERLK